MSIDTYYLVNRDIFLPSLSIMFVLENLRKCGIDVAEPVEHPDSKSFWL